MAITRARVKQAEKRTGGNREMIMLGECEGKVADYESKKIYRDIKQFKEVNSIGNDIIVICLGVPKPREVYKGYEDLSK